jgi:hypothetical protein
LRLLRQQFELVQPILSDLPYHRNVSLLSLEFGAPENTIARDRRVAVEKRGRSQWNPT